MSLYLEHVVPFFFSVIKRDRRVWEKLGKTNFKNFRNEKTKCENSKYVKDVGVYVTAD